MEEIILTNKKHGMRTLIVCILLELLFVAGTAGGIILSESTNGFPSLLGDILAIGSMVLLCVAWIPLVGLRVLKPQEALVLTLFGKYIGTLKGEGFYAINPFCSAVNPAAKTKLNQSGDVSHKATPLADATASTPFGNIENKKISLKNHDAQ